MAVKKAIIHQPLSVRLSLSLFVMLSSSFAFLSRHSVHSTAWLNYYCGSRSRLAYDVCRRTNVRSRSFVWSDRSEMASRTVMKSSSGGTAMNPFYSNDCDTFQSLDDSLGENSDVIKNLKSMGIERPSNVQVSSFADIAAGEDVIIGAETGSGKTMAYLLPLLYKLGGDNHEYGYCKAIILVPNKELSNQVVRMCNSVFPDVKVGVLPGGLKNPVDYRPFRLDASVGDKIDLCVTTPAALAPFALSPKNVDFFADIRTLVLDEADMLLDGGFLPNLNQVLMGFRRADRLDESLGIAKTQFVFVAATIPDFGLKSVDAFINKRFPDAVRVKMPGMHNARHYGLKNRTLWIPEGSNKERLSALVELINNDFQEDREKVMVFLNSVGDVDAATGALRRAGINAIPYHAKLKLGERTSNLNEFREYCPEESSENENVIMPVLVCTDLASRGLDIPGVTVVVQLQFATNVVAHLHRMGRAGRAGNITGKGIIFYDEEGTESLLVNVIREAESNQDSMTIEGNEIDPDDLDQAKIKNAFSRKRGFAKKRKKYSN